MDLYKTMAIIKRNLQYSIHSNSYFSMLMSKKIIQIIKVIPLNSNLSHSLRLAISPMTVIDRNGLRIIFTFERDENILTIHSKATNSTPYPMMNFVFKAAVPKVRARESPSNRSNHFFVSDIQYRITSIKWNSHSGK